MNENRQIFINAYMTNGYNATQAYKTAYPNCKTGHQQNGSRLMLNVVIKEAIDKAKEDLKEWLEGGRKLVDKLFSDQYKASVSANDRTNAVRCVENKAKNVGYYALDNAQRVEQVKLDKAEAAECQRIANILNFEAARKGKAG